ncbi:MAG TPA: dihydrodipicolinate synthase family protein [Verrucomicrobiota bacterium]|nr:dihydrodipicolinate synthase family protein [Verrucomicrobiota bacterium]
MSFQKLQGIVPPMVTPLLDRDVLDAAGLEKLVEHILSGGVSGLFILGTTGEGPSLSYRLRREVIDRVCRQVKCRVPVLVSVTDTAFVESVQLAKYAADAGASAVVVAPPYYLPEGQPELREYLEHLVPELPLPLFLYNMPSLTKVFIEPETVRDALNDPRIVGFKDSSGNLEYFSRVVQLAKQRPDWSVLIGPEEKLAEATLAGGNGGVNGGANIYPRLYVELFKAASSGDKERTNELHSLVIRVSDGLYKIGQHSSAIIKGIKCALSVSGLCDDFMAEPFRRFRPAQRARVEAVVNELNALTSRI